MTCPICHKEMTPSEKRGGWLYRCYNHDMPIIIFKPNQEAK